MTSLSTNENDDRNAAHSQPKQHTHDSTRAVVPALLGDDAVVAISSHVKLLPFKLPTQAFSCVHRWRSRAFSEIDILVVRDSRRCTADANKATGETQRQGLVAHQQHPRPPPLASMDSCESLWSCQQDAPLVAMNTVTLEGGSGAWRAMLLAMLLDAIRVHPIWT
jgi:hypothetical protein